MDKLKSILTGKYMLWLILAIPGIISSIKFFNGELGYDLVMHITGEFAGRMLIVSLIATPINLMLPRASFSKWLLRNRRFFGVSAFAYTLLHTIFYVLEYPWNQLYMEFSDFSIITGWVAFFIFIPLTITSTDYAIRKMGAAWKKLQRWVYLAGILAFVHWALLGLEGESANINGAMAHFMPVLILQIYRVWKQSSNKKN